MSFIRFIDGRALRRALGIAGLALALAAPAAAQADTTQDRLSLDRAIQLAMRQNLDLAAARGQRAVAQAGIRTAQERPNPTANFTALRDTPHEGLFFDQPIELGGKRRRRIGLAKEQVQLTEVDIATLGRQLRRQVRESYYNLALERARTGLAQQALALAERLDQIAKERYQAGDVAELEVIQADLGVAQAQAQVQVARQEEEVALSRLNVLLNEPSGRDWQLTSPMAAPLPPVSLQMLLQRAYQSNPELERLTEAKRVEERHYELLQAERIPNLGLQFGTDFNSPGAGGFRVGPRGQLSMTLPLFSRNQGELAASLATERVLEDELFAARRRVTGQVDETYLELETRETQVDLYRSKLVPVAHRLEGMSEESYHAGKAGILAVLDAQRNVRQVEGEYLDSLFAEQQAFGALEEAAGAPLE